MKKIEFKKLNNRNLLAYYRAERLRFILAFRYEEENEKYNIWNVYLSEIKTELSKRPHITK